MKYIAYGSNMSIEQMAYRCPDAYVAGIGYLENHKLEFYLHATVEPANDGNKVPVVVWEISPEDEKALDVYEGVPNYYVKQTATVRMSDGEEIVGLIYIMNRFRDFPPSQAYFEGIASAYKRFGFKKELQALHDARSRSVIASWNYTKSYYKKGVATCR